MEKKKISGEIFGYVIRRPGEEGAMRYIIGDDPKELMGKYYDGYNPVCALVRLDKAIITDPNEITKDAGP